MVLEPAIRDTAAAIAAPTRRPGRNRPRSEMVLVLALGPQDFRCGGRILRRDPHRRSSAGPSAAKS